METNQFANMQKYLEKHAQNVINAQKKKFDVTLDEQKAKILKLINEDNYELSDLKKELKLLYEIAIQADEYMKPENMVLFVGTFCEHKDSMERINVSVISKLFEELNVENLAILLGVDSESLSN